MNRAGIQISYESLQRLNFLEIELLGMLGDDGGDKYSNQRFMLFRHPVSLFLFEFLMMMMMNNK